MNDYDREWRRRSKAYDVREEEERRKPRKAIRHYRPLGFVVVISFLVFGNLLQWGIDPLISVFSTLLIALLMVMFS